MFAICNAFYYLYFKETGVLNQFYILQIFFLPIIVFFIYWLLKVLKNKSAANFKNTMRMNLIAAVCMNTSFTFIYFINH